MEYTREKSVVHVVFLRTTNFSTFLACVHLVNIRATLGLACAQAATLCTQVVGNTRSYLSLLRVRVALNLRSLRIHTPRLCRFVVFQYKPTPSANHCRRGAHKMRWTVLNESNKLAQPCVGALSPHLPPSFRITVNSS